jgi:small subunit ribosomal protein S6
MNKYEISVLYDPSLEVDLDKAEEQIKKIFTANKAKIVDSDNWGKRKLAYPIKKQDYAVYVFYTVEMPGENVAKIEATLNITDEVLRYLIVKPDYKARDAAEAEKQRKAKNRRDDDSSSRDSESEE